MALRSFVLVTMTAMLAAACSSAAPKDDPSPTMPARDRNDTEPSTGGGDGTAIEGSPATPSCQDSCSLEGERRCTLDGKNIEVCLRAQSGCLAFATRQCTGGAACEPAKIDECSDEAIEPATGDAGADAGATCTSNCSSAGAKRCVSGSNSFETCKEVTPGCLRWQGAKACGAGMECTGAGVCTCDHQCTTLDASACSSPTQFKTCVKNANGCRVWSALKDCVRATPSPGCFAYSKACFGTCNDACSTEGSVTCSGPSSYVECVRNSSDQCLKIETGSCKTSTVCFASPKLCADGT